MYNVCMCVGARFGWVRTKPSESSLLLPLIEPDSQSFSPTVTAAGCLPGAPTPVRPCWSGPSCCRSMGWGCVGCTGREDSPCGSTLHWKLLLVPWSPSPGSSPDCWLKSCEHSPGSVQSPEPRRWGWWGCPPGRPWWVWLHCLVWWTRYLSAEKCQCSWCCCSSWWSTALMKRPAVGTLASRPFLKRRDRGCQRDCPSSQSRKNYWRSEGHPRADLWELRPHLCCGLSSEAGLRLQVSCKTWGEVVKWYSSMSMKWNMKI